MREIIHIQGGQCGNQIGYNFWETIAKEHHINEVGSYQPPENNTLENLDVYFKEINNSRYVPRSILFDLEPGTIDSIRGN